MWTVMEAVRANDNRYHEKDREIQLRRAGRIVGNEGWKSDLGAAGYSKLKGEKKGIKEGRSRQVRRVKFLLGTSLANHSGDSEFVEAIMNPRRPGRMERLQAEMESLWSKECLYNNSN